MSSGPPAGTAMILRRPRRFTRARRLRATSVIQQPSGIAVRDTPGRPFRGA